LLLVEADVAHSNDKGLPVSRATEGRVDGSSSWLARIVGELFDRMIQDGFRRDVFAKMPSWMNENPYLTNIQTHSLLVPVGWTPDPDKPEVGTLFGRNILCALDSNRPYFLARGVPEAEVDSWEKNTRLDIESGRVKIFTRFYFCTAQVQHN